MEFKMSKHPVKIRKTGNAMVLTVPQNFDIKKDQVYNVYQADDGDIVFTPVRGDIYDEQLTGQVKFQSEDGAEIWDVKLVGKEDEK
ncbi:MAG: hypothetical protein LBM27_03240 [Lactobacillaceae bacterium]|jgi:antitoxin component of MazEF toxin-antitoxin module|nr:hypothetical protein [Lactobacillaceae bacterium]